jgi:hypothetical protein
VGLCFAYVLGNVSVPDITVLFSFGTLATHLLVGHLRGKRSYIVRNVACCYEQCCWGTIINPKSSSEDDLLC